VDVCALSIWKTNGYLYGRAHLALQGPDLTSVLRSTDSLHNALAWGIEMIRDEMLGLMAATNSATV